MTNGLQVIPNGVEAVMGVFDKIDIADCARKSGIDEAIIRSTARTIALADSVAGS